jgi:hypothetical protein
MSANIEIAGTAIPPSQFDARALSAAVDAYLGEDPTLAKLTAASLILANPLVLPLIIDRLVVAPDEMIWEEDSPHVIVRHDDDGHRIESFHALPLIQSASGGWNARLHVWLPEHGGAHTRDVHTHAQPFGSTVVAGSFTDQVHVHAPFAEGERVCVYDSNQQAEPSQETTLRPTTNRVVRAGETHTMPPTLIHNATVDTTQGMVATLVVRGRPVTDTGAAFTQGLRQGSAPWREPIDPVEDLRRVKDTIRFERG